MANQPLDAHSIAVLAPEYPMPTHTFIRREIACLRELGGNVHVFSTRAPALENLARGWAKEAQSQTTYLVPFDTGNVLDILTYLPRAPFISLFLSAAKEGKDAFKDALLCLPAAARLAAECRRRGVRHIHAHMASRSALVAALAAHMAKLPYSITHHGALRDFGPNQRFKWSKVAFAMIITQQLRNELADALAPKAIGLTVVQPMGVDSGWFQRWTPYEPRKPEEPLRVFSCGRISRVKGHDILIEAVAQRVAAGDNIQLEIAGGTGGAQVAEAKALSELTRARGIEERVIFLGAISETEVREKLNAAHVFVLASRYEAFGVAYLEAMSCGVPTIGTNVGGVPEIIVDGECGFLVPPEDPIALAQALERLGSEPGTAEAISRAGRARVVEKFPIAASARKLMQYAFRR